MRFGARQIEILDNRDCNIIHASACISESAYLMMRKDFLSEALHAQFAMLPFGRIADLGFFSGVK